MVFRLPKFSAWTSSTAIYTKKQQHENKNKQTNELKKQKAKTKQKLNSESILISFQSDF